MRLTMLALPAALLGATPAMPADPQLGAEIATQCSGCHGAAGVSTGPDFPNLAAQKAGYIEAQLEAFRAGDRENPLMNAIAASLTDSDIENLAAHFASLPGAEPGAVASNLSGLDGMLPEFPENYVESFVRYDTIDFEDRGQVRHYWANQAAVDAAAAGEDFPEGAFLLVEIFGAETDADGNIVTADDGAFVQTDLVALTAMEKGAGWGEDVPEIIRNGDWRYAVFSPDGARNDGVNEGPCLACHKPLTDTDYSFTYDAMQAHAEAD